MAPPSRPPYARGFAVDTRTERALRAGLAGRDVKIHRGRLESALKTLSAEPASRLVFVDLDGVSEPEAAAKQLADVCAFETVLVAVGSTDSARFGRALLQRGIADYLVKPLSAATVRQTSVALIEDAPEHLYAGDIIAFAGSPGSGVSTLVAAIARSVAAEGRTVSIVDVDPMSGKLARLLGVEPADGLSSLPASLGPDAAEHAEPQFDADRIDGMSVDAAPGISLLAYPPAGPLPEPAAVPALSLLFKRLANRTHVVLVSGMPDPETQLQVMHEANARILLYEPTMPSVSAAARQLARLGADRPAALVQCSTRGRRYALSPAHVRYALADRRPDVVIPFEPALHAGSTGKAPGRPGKAYRKALLRVMEFVGRGHRA